MNVCSYSQTVGCGQVQVWLNPVSRDRPAVKPTEKKAVGRHVRICPQSHAWARNEFTMRIGQTRAGRKTAHAWTVPGAHMRINSEFGASNMIIVGRPFFLREHRKTSNERPSYNYKRAVQLWDILCPGKHPFHVKISILVVPAATYIIIIPRPSNPLGKNAGPTSDLCSCQPCWRLNVERLWQRRRLAV